MRRKLWAIRELFSAAGGVMAMMYKAQLVWGCHEDKRITDRRERYLDFT